MEQTIKTKEEYKHAANRLEKLIHAEPETAEAAELKSLIQAIISYEKAEKELSRKRTAGPASNLGLLHRKP